MVGEIVLKKYYQFVTTETQLMDVVSLIEKDPESLAGIILLVDGKPLLDRYSAKESSKILAYLAAISSKLDVSILLVRHTDDGIDLRFQHQITHSCKVIAVGIPGYLAASEEAAF